MTIASARKALKPWRKPASMDGIIMLMWFLGALFVAGFGIGGFLLVSELMKPTPIVTQCDQATAADPLRNYTRDICIRAGGPAKEAR